MKCSNLQERVPLWGYMKNKTLKFRHFSDSEWLLQWFLFPKRPSNNAQHPLIYTHYGGEQFITGWAQRVNGSFSLFNIKCVDRGRIRVILFRFLQLRRVSVPGFDQQRKDGQAGGRGAPPHLWVSLLPWKPCLAYLTPVLMTSHARIVHSEKFFSIQYPAWLQRQASGGCVCGGVEFGGVGVLWDNND